MELKHFESHGAVFAHMVDGYLQSLRYDLQQTREEDDDPERVAELQATIADIEVAWPRIMDAVDGYAPTTRALSLLLADVENGTDFGMPFERDDHPFHASVTAAREALGRTA